MKKLYNGYTEEKWAKICSDPYYKNSLDAMIEKADNFAKTEPPQLKFTDLHAFVTTGDRSAYERAYNEYNSRVDSFFMAYMITKDEKYIDLLANAIWNVCSIETWALPAHVSENVSIERRYSWIELVSANQGKRLGEILAIMEDKLPDLVVKKLKHELRERIVEPYLDDDRRADFWWRRGVSNWAAVCVCGVFGGFLYAATPEEIEKMLPEFCATADSFLESMDDDGCCKEGYGYWSYGFSYFCRFAEMLRNYTEGKIDYFKNPKVHAIAKYQENLSMNDTQCIRYSDCGEFFRPNAPHSQFLKTIYPDVQIPAFPSISGILGFHDILWIDPKLSDCKMEPCNYTFHDAQQFIHKTHAYNFACKAGYNNEPHNHNDIGSFLISKNNKITFTDPGGGEYTRQYFSDLRYTILEPSSRSHSVPIINGNYQVGNKIKSTMYIDEEHEYKFSMENGYNIDTLKSLSRHFICGETELTLIDSYEFTETPESIVERFVSLVEPTIEEGKVTVGASVMTYDTSVFSISMSTDTCVRSKTNHETLYMVDLTMKKPEKKFEATFKFN